MADDRRRVGRFARDPDRADRDSGAGRRRARCVPNVDPAHVAITLAAQMLLVGERARAIGVPPTRSPRRGRRRREL